MLEEFSLIMEILSQRRSLKENSHLTQPELLFLIRYYEDLYNIHSFIFISVFLPERKNNLFFTLDI